MTDDQEPLVIPARRFVQLVAVSVAAEAVASTRRDDDIHMQHLHTCLDRLHEAYADETEDHDDR